MSEPESAALPASRPSVASTGGCICPKPAKNADGTFDWQIRPDCAYHALAAAYPDDHGIPWNCPTYWDGCNCDKPAKASEAVGGSRNE